RHERLVEPIRTLDLWKRGDASSPMARVVDINLLTRLCRVGDFLECLDHVFVRWPLLFWLRRSRRSIVGGRQLEDLCGRQRKPAFQKVLHEIDVADAAAETRV